MSVHHMPMVRWVIPALLGLVAWAAGGSAVNASAPSPQIGGAAVEGIVLDRLTGDPVAGALASIPELGLTDSSDGSGSFGWSSISLGRPSRTVTISVVAPGYGDWVVRDARLVQDDILLVEAELGADPVEILVPPPVSERTSFPVEQIAAAPLDGLAVDQTGLPIPSTIRVRVTGYPYCDTSRPYTVTVVDFLDYAKHVLPSEWGASWPGESLRAGAMAVKMYAWSYIAAGGKWPDADVYDSTCDQVYNPAIAYASTNNAVNFTWDWRLTRDNALVRTFYRAYVSQCPGPDCMGQWESRDMAYDRYSWDEILQFFYEDTDISAVHPPPGGWSLRYEGNGYGDLDRVKFLLDGPSRPIDVGAGDFTLEWWMKATPGENDSGACSSGAEAWRFGNALFDRDVYGGGDYGEYGTSLAGGRLAFGVSQGATGLTICGATPLDDGDWHHVAVTRRGSDGWLAVYIDGALEAEGDGPDGDVSYRDGRTTSYGDDSYLVVAAEKHDLDSELYPSFRGWIDEIRISDALRYVGPFAIPSGPFAPDADTVGLYHFDLGYGNTIQDSSGAAGGPSHGSRSYGGVVNGPEWTIDTPWMVDPTPTPTTVPPATATASGPAPTHTATPTRTATATSTRTLTPTTTPTHTSTATWTAVPTATVTPPLTTATPTLPPTSTPSMTAAPDTTPTRTPTGSHTPSATPIPGDLSQDGVVDVVDIQLCVNVVLGTQTDAEVILRADLNHDGSVNIVDVQLTVNLVLNGS